MTKQEVLNKIKSKEEHIKLLNKIKKQNKETGKDHSSQRRLDRQINAIKDEIKKYEEIIDYFENWEKEYVEKCEKNKNNVSTKIQIKYNDQCVLNNCITVINKDGELIKFELNKCPNNPISEKNGIKDAFISIPSFCKISGNKYIDEYTDFQINNDVIEKYRGKERIFVEWTDENIINIINECFDCDINEIEYIKLV